MWVCSSDISGQLLSTYIREVGESAYKQQETPVYGSSRLGLWQHQQEGTDDLSFELKDHLNRLASMEGSVIQPTSRLEFEDGLRMGV